MPDANYRKLRIENGDLIDSATSEKIGRIRSVEIVFDPDYLLGLANRPSMSEEGGHGPEGPPSQQSLLGMGSPTEPSSREPKFDAAKAVWEHYVQVMKPRSAGLHPDMRRVINDALKVATIDELKRAIDGCASSEFHMGKNDGNKGRGKKYNRLSLIIKGRRGQETTRERIDFFLELADKSGLVSGVLSADPGKVAQAKRDVLDAFDFADEQVQERGMKAREWLESLGYEIGTNPETGRPTFRGRGEA